MLRHTNVPRIAMRMWPVKAQHGTHESYAGRISELTTTGSDVMTDSTSTSRLVLTKVRSYWSVWNRNVRVCTVCHIEDRFSAIPTALCWQKFSAPCHKDWFLLNCLIKWVASIEWRYFWCICFVCFDIFYEQLHGTHIYTGDELLWFGSRQEPMLSRSFLY